ncbi:hypothetical protein HBI79_037080 [Parastagonospora nodorum]|nr:hypothetical protein HBI79_037080 [Parastagonospora nodorum]
MECNALLHLAKGALYQRDELLRMYNESSAGLPIETDDDSDDTDDGIEDSAVIPAPLYRTQCKRKEGACQLHRCKFFHNSQLGEYGDIRDSLPKNPMEVKMLEIQG